MLNLLQIATKHDVNVTLTGTTTVGLMSVMRRACQNSTQLFHLMMMRRLQRGV